MFPFHFNTIRRLSTSLSFLSLAKYFFMVKSLLLICFAFCFLFSNAQQIRTPAPSPSQEVSQDFGLSQVEVSYSRPSVKERKIFGDLVPFGKVWRTGANQATTITFGDDVSFGDKPVKAGKYGLLTIPGEKEWTIILSKQLDVTSPAAYKEDQDVARITVPAQELPISVESFLITFDNIRASSMDMLLLWDKTVVPVTITSDIDKKIMAQIDNAMNKDNRPYFSAAMYYTANGKDLNQALTWFNKAIEQSPDAFFIYYQKASTLKKLGKKAEAIATAKKSMELAKKAKNDDYIALNEKLIDSLN